MKRFLRPRFRIVTLLLMVFAISVPCAMTANRRAAYQRARRIVGEANGSLIAEPDRSWLSRLGLAEDTGTIVALGFPSLTVEMRSGRPLARSGELDVSTGQVPADSDLHFLGAQIVELAQYPSRFHDGVLPALAGVCQSLHVADLRNPAVTNVNLRQLRGFTKLQVLMLSGASITDAGLKELPALQNLTSLHLTSTAVTDRGLNVLQSLKNLRYLDLRNTHVSEQAIQELQMALKSLVVYSDYDKSPP